jgi:hypothetical protein
MRQAVSNSPLHAKSFLQQSQIRCPLAVLFLEGIPCALQASLAKTQLLAEQPRLARKLLPPALAAILFDPLPRCGHLVLQRPPLPHLVEVIRFEPD